MIKRTFIYLILLLLISGCTKDEKSIETEKHFSIHGLQLGASVKDVTAILGKESSKSQFEGSDAHEYTIYSYPELFLGFRDDSLVLISSTDPEFGTETGIYINDDKRKVLLKYPNEEIFCQSCDLKDEMNEIIASTLYVQVDDYQIVFGGDSPTVKFIQIGREIPINLMFSHSINPVESNGASAEELKEQLQQLEKNIIEKLADQYKNNEVVRSIVFSSDTPSEEILQMAEQGKLLGFPFSLGSSYKEIIEKLGPPDREGIFGEGSYNLIYGNFNLAFNYEDLYEEENRFLETKLLSIQYNITNNIDFSSVDNKFGALKDQYEYEGYIFSKYNIGENLLTVETKLNNTFDKKDDKVTTLQLEGLPTRYNFQLKGTDGKIYDLKIYSRDENAELINMDDTWYSHLSSYPMYSGNYTAVINQNGKQTDKQEIGFFNFLLEDNSSSATIIASPNGPDVLLITQKLSASFTNYQTFIIKNGKLTEVSFEYENEPAEPYFEGLRFSANNEWETLAFSNASSVQWLGFLWELDEESEVFRYVDTIEYPYKPW